MIHFAIRNSILYRWRELKVTQLIAILLNSPYNYISNYASLDHTCHLPNFGQLDFWVWILFESWQGFFTFWKNFFALEFLSGKLLLIHLHIYIFNNQQNTTFIFVDCIRRRGGNHLSSCYLRNLFFKRILNFSSQINKRNNC